MLMHVLLATLCCGLTPPEKQQNVIHLGEYRATVESDWTIMAHVPPPNDMKSLSVAIPGAHLLPDLGVTYCVIDTTTKDGQASYDQLTDWHADASRTKEYKTFTCYAAVKTNGRGAKVLALNYVLNSSAANAKVLVTIFKPAPDGFSGDLEQMMDRAHAFAERIAKTPKP